MAFFKEDLLKVKAFIFDVDGVLSSDYSPMNDVGEPVRTANVKDGYAIGVALQKGYPVAIISGAKNENIRKRYQKLGIEYIFLGAKSKIEKLNEYMKIVGLNLADILYMGDDIPDYEILRIVGVSTCPADAVPEIKSVSKYISNREGGRGCVRDVIEQVLRSQGNWPVME